jgi:hypothetical protein
MRVRELNEDVSGTHPGAPLMRVVQTCERHGGLNGSDLLAREKYECAGCVSEARSLERLKHIETAAMAFITAVRLSGYDSPAARVTCLDALVDACTPASDAVSSRVSEAKGG